MRISAVLCTIALLAAHSVATFADSHMGGSGFYGSIGGGAVLVGDSDKAKHGDDERSLAFSFGFGGSGAVGYDFGDFRVDAEVSYLSSSFKYSLKKDDDVTAKGSLSILGGTANAWYDIDTGTAWTPYIGAGAGGANISAKITENKKIMVDNESIDSSFSGSAWAFAYQGGAGVQYQLTDAIALDLGYRLLGAFSAKLTQAAADGEKAETLTPSIMTHRVTLGVKFSF